MTEAVFAAALTGLLWSTLRYRDSQSAWALLAAAAASSAASLTRYEGWFLIPFVALYVLSIARRKSHAIVFAALASLGPLAWLAHNQYYYSNALEFLNGEYSAQAIYARQLAQGVARYPGDHDWHAAFQYYFAAMKLADGWPLLVAGALGAVVAVAKKNWWPLLLLALPPAFYPWSIHSSGTPLYVPGLWPHQWYNTRYALAALPLAAFAAASLVAAAKSSSPGGKLQAGVAAVLISAITGAWFFAGAPVTWKESEVNSMARRAWTQQAADYLAAHYRPGDGIIYSFGDLTGALRQAGIPLREGLQQGNHPAWDAATLRPDLFLHEQWGLAVSGDPVATAILRAQRQGPHYELRKQIIVEGAPVIEIYQRQRPEYSSPREPR
jgi:4-amino-4-deoxy-L-arabinose transferase-like glycosyltransferase